MLESIGIRLENNVGSSWDSWRRRGQRTKTLKNCWHELMLAFTWKYDMIYDDFDHWHIFFNKYIIMLISSIFSLRGEGRFLKLDYLKRIRLYFLLKSIWAILDQFAPEKKQVSENIF